MAARAHRRAPSAHIAYAWALAAVLLAGAARAEEPPPEAADDEVDSLPGQVELRAEDVEIDARTRELDVEGNVRVDASPFHLRSEKLHVRRSPHGVEIEGAGRLAFCPCLGSPLAIDFHAATVAPPGDLILTSPSLVVYGVPVAWLPYFWLRSGARAGLLPPELAYRGRDGVFLGGGAHLPAGPGGDGEQALDLRAGAYLVGGTAVDGRLVTEASVTHVRWDHLRGDGLEVDLRGSSEGGETLTWDVDALRGARGVVSTTELDAAARPYDRAAVGSTARFGAWTVGTGVRAAARRGGELSSVGAVGPVAFVRNAGALGFVGSYDLTLEGGVLRDDSADPSGAAVDTVGVARADLGATLAERLGPVVTSLGTRGTFGLAGGGASASPFGVARADLRAALPLERAFGSPPDLAGGDAPLVHRLEPSVGAALLTVHEDDTAGLSAGRGAVVRGAAWVADGALATALSRWGSRAGAELAVRGGIVGDLDGAAPLAFATRARAAVQGDLLALGAEGAQVTPLGAGAAGGALIARGRVGPSAGLHALLLAAGRDGIDPVLARALTESALEPGSGFLSAPGWTGGAALAIPFAGRVITAGGVDADLTRGELVAARASVELRDGCRCVVLRATASHRIGREGVDAALTLDLAPKP